MRLSTAATATTSEESAVIRAALEAGATLLTPLTPTASPIATSATTNASSLGRWRMVRRPAPVSPSPPRVASDAEGCVGAMMAREAPS